MTQVTESQKDTKKKRNFPFVFLGKLVRNSIFLILIICFLLCLLYLIGNFQFFTDKTQLMILSVLSVIAAILSVMSLIAIILEFVFLFMKSKKTISFFSILFYIFTTLLGCGFIMLATIIRRLAAGV